MNRVGTRLGLAAAILGAVVLLVRSCVKSGGEPVVRGVPLSEWMQLEDRNSDEYLAAVAEMDERCVRWLIRELDWSPTSMRTRIDGLMFRVMRQPITPEARPDYRAAALTLSKLGPRAQPAVAALRFNASVPGSNYRDSEAQSMAIAALVLVGADSLDAWADKLLDPTNTNWEPYALAAGVLQTNAAPIVPRLVHNFETTTDDGVKERITTSLLLIHSSPALSMPIFMASLTNGNSRTRRDAIIGLNSFGPESKSAWNGLVLRLSDSDKAVRFMATNILRQIDREAAGELGIK